MPGEVANANRPPRVVVVRGVRQFNSAQFK